eukprot:PhF_6_TR16397/c0_g1_i1/m.25202
MRRFSVTPQSLSASLHKQSSRTYFYSGAGESGIWAHTMKSYVTNIIWAVPISSTFAYIWVLHPSSAWSSERQYAPFASDLYMDDGTQMEGADAVANLQLHHDRIMPFMQEIKGKMEAAGLPTSGIAPPPKKKDNHSHDSHHH